MSDPGPRMKVSVAMMTYNQAAYIGQAMDSVLMQECDFEFECIVCDDRSTDGTPEILQEYQRSHPDRVRLVLREENVGSQRNLAGLLAECTGQYMAYLEGDDFWTSPHKLQRQVDFMDANPGCAVCFHDKDVLNEGSQPTVVTPMVRPPARSGIEDLLRGNYITACTVMYRRGLIDRLPEWWADVWIGDLTLHVLHAQHGWIGYIDEIMATYRVHGGGLWSGKGMAAQIDAFIDVLRRLDKTLDYRYHDAVEASVFANNHHAAVMLRRDGRPDMARPYVHDCVRHWRMRGGVPLRELWWMALETDAPRLATVAHGVMGSLPLTRDASAARKPG